MGFLCPEQARYQLGVLTQVFKEERAMTRDISLLDKFHIDSQTPCRNLLELETCCFLAETIVPPLPYVKVTSSTIDNHEDLAGQDH